MALKLKKWKTDFEYGDDKCYHFLMGLTLMGAAWFMGVPLALGVSLVFGVLYGKEFVDSLGYGTPDYWDLLCGVGGLVVAIIIILFINHAVKEYRNEQRELKR